MTDGLALGHPRFGHGALLAVHEIDLCNSCFGPLLGIDLCLSRVLNVIRLSYRFLLLFSVHHHSMKSSFNSRTCTTSYSLKIR